MKVRAQYRSIYTHELPPERKQSQRIKRWQDYTLRPAAHSRSLGRIFPTRQWLIRWPGRRHLLRADGEPPEFSFSAARDRVEVTLKQSCIDLVI